MIERLEERTLPAVTALGAEFQVNANSNVNSRTFPQTPQAVANDSAGDFVVTWADSTGLDGSAYGVFAQRYNSAGVSQGAVFQVNTTTTGSQLWSTVAMDPSGDFIVTWTDYSGLVSSGARIAAQRYNALGVTQGREFQVNTSTVGNQRFPSVAMDASGDFVVTWTGYDSSGTGIFAQLFNSIGTPVGSQFQVNTFTPNNQILSRVATDPNGNFIITWESYLQDGSGFGIFAQRYNASGARVGGEFRVNSTTARNQALASVAVDSLGDFVIVWASFLQDGSGYGVFAQRYNAAGARVGGEFRINVTTLNNQQFPTVATDPEGDFVVTWSSFGQDGSGYGIFGRVFNPAGQPLSGEFRINTFTPNNQVFSSVAMDSQGDFVTVWSSYGQAGTGYGVFGQRFSTANLPPVNTVPIAQTTVVNVPLLFNTFNGNQISVFDPDAGSNPIEVTMTATQGTFSLFSTVGLSFLVGDGLNDVTMSFTGSQSAINNALNGLVFTPNANFIGLASLTIATDDLGNTGTGGPKTAKDTVLIQVNQSIITNQPPVNIVPGPQSTPVNTTLVFSAANGNRIGTSDPDAGSNPVQVTLSVTQGTLTLSTTAGLTFTSGNGIGNGLMKFTGTLVSINNALNGLVYSPPLNFQGTVTLTILTNDLGNTGTGGAMTDLDTVAITMTPAQAVNQPPVNIVPGTQTTTVNTPLVFSAANGNRIATSDPDAGLSPVQVTLVAGQGTLTLAGTAGLTFTTGDGTNDASMTFTGTLAAINTALNGLVFTPALNFVGTAPITIITNDLGNTGSGGAKSDTDTVSVLVVAAQHVNLPPVNAVPGPQLTPLNTPLVFSTAAGNAISTSDPDAGADPVQVTLSASQGVLTLGSTFGLTFLVGDGSGDATMVFTGTLANINFALNGLTFTPTTNFVGTGAVTITTNDLGHNGTGGAKSDTDSVAITVFQTQGTNQPPVNIVPGPQTTAVNTPLVFSLSNGNRIATTDPDAGANTVQITLNATQGVLSLATKTGLTFQFGDGTSDATMVFTGTLASVNNALNGMVFVPTANFQGSASVTISTNDLGHTGTGGAQVDTDTVPITVGSTGTLVTYDSTTNTLTITGVASETILVGSSNGILTVTVNGVLNTSFGTVASGTVQAINVTGGPGNNRIDLSGVTAAAFHKLTSVIIDGGDGNDTLIGSDFNDTILGGNGNDGIDGRLGNDNLNGQAGNDTLLGADGNDTLRGGNGVDILVGGAGNDDLDGQGSTGDTLQGGTGVNILNLQSGTDVQDETTVFKFDF